MLAIGGDGFLPGVASGLLVLCGRFLVWRDWVRFRSGTAVARVFENGGVLARGWLSGFGAWFLAIGWGVVLGLGSGLFRHGCWRAYPERGVDCLAGRLAGVWRG